MEIREHVALAQYTTLGVGGPARYFCEVTREEQLVEAVRFADERGLPVFVLGGGSNLLVADAGFPGLVVRAGIDGRVVSGLSSPHSSQVDFDVPAGMGWDDFVRRTCLSRHSGIECLAGIPGLVGGSPVQNIGAYGQEVSQTIVSVRVFDLEEMEFRELGAEECGFAYRTSIFNSTHRGRFVVCRVRFRLALDGLLELRYADLQRHFAGRSQPGGMEVYEAVREIRATKGMLAGQGGTDGMSAGSFFKNPIVLDDAVGAVAVAAGVAVEEVPRYAAGEGQVKLPAAWLVERAGFRRGFAMGRAGISSRHTLALVNLGGATAADVVALRDAVIEGVGARFGIRLEQEPMSLGFDK